MPTLLLMRHAKSDWDTDYDADQDRPLNKRGVRSARLMGRLVAGLDMVPDLAVSSDALRARATVELAAEAGGWGCPLEFESGLYGSGPDAVLSLAAALPPVGSVMLVGHQPTWSLLVQRLTGARAELKTASIAAIDLTIDDWSELEQAQGMLTALHNPRPYFGSEWDAST